ncbi:helix-turn-helix domain-containing protein [Clostridium sp. DJ247]|uniref:winged helix-turn-helix transcriptional regulator n=1 Tax=Clostridium sp. DJ247 TaxID=2726188 RepID=UPI00162AB625|nr:helix-turn-helix domain-containing protein [Clostridium sp. DJ247]MBC2578834.1 helix-turn-helix transcriptional regulator [Clostridium sp. DJ247]
MGKMYCNKEEFCPIAIVQRLIAGKWKLIILWHLSKNTRRFGELERLLPEISQGILTQQLRELERDGLVHREVYREVPPKVEYSLTDMGKEFLPIFKVMNDIGNSYINQKFIANKE